MNKLYLCFPLAFAAVFALPFTTYAVTVPEGFSVETVAGGLIIPTSVAPLPDGRMLIAEKGGTVRVLKNGGILPTPLVVLNDETNDFADRGLLGIAAHPNFSQNGFVYLLYTYENSPDNFSGSKTGRLVRYKVTGDTVDPASKVVILGTVGGSPSQPSCYNFEKTADCIPSDSPSHSTGGLRFGPDGKLYVALGDGAGFYTVDQNAKDALNVDSLAGKILRLNDDGTAPADNPFYNGNPNANRSKVWAYGFRNPFRFNFNPNSGALFVGDVGWGSWEEINIVTKGGNYGWPCREGFVATPGYDCATVNYINPVYVYDHAPGTGAVVGGAFATSDTYPEGFKNRYVFGDFSQNFLKTALAGPNSTLVSIENFTFDPDGPVEIITGPDGRIYYLSIYAGELRRITYHDSGGTTNLIPAAQVSATPRTGDAPLSVTFSGEGSFDPDGDTLSYSWNFGDGGFAQEKNPTHIYMTEGVYTATLLVSDGRGGSDTKSIQIAVGDTGAEAPAPVLTITSVAPDVVYVGRPVTITAGVKNNGASKPIIVDIEVYTTAGTQVAQKFEGVTIGSGATQTFTLEWLPPGVGAYRVAIGLFHEHWAGLYAWHDATVIFGVEDRSPVLEVKPVHVKTTIPSEATVSGGVLISTEIKNEGGPGMALVDIEVYDDDVKVAQVFYDNEYFDAGETRTFAFNWKPTEPGRYRIPIGLMGPNWSMLHQWVNDAASVVVSEGGTLPPSNPAWVYDDSLVNGWVNWSWTSNVDLAFSGSTESGASSVKVAFTEPWSGLNFHHDTGVDTTGKNAVTFALSGATDGGQDLQMFLYDSDWNILMPPVAIDSRVSEPLLPDQALWQTVRVPLSELSGLNSVITGIAIQGRSGEVEKPFLVDSVRIE